MFTLKIKTDNAAFRDDTDDEGADTGAAACEVARILREVAGRLENDATSGSCLDCNGNTVGSFTLTRR